VLSDTLVLLVNRYIRKTSISVFIYSLTDPAFIFIDVKFPEYVQLPVRFVI